MLNFVRSRCFNGVVAQNNGDGFDVDGQLEEATAYLNGVGTGSFWDQEFESRAMKTGKEFSATLMNVRVRINAEKRERENGLMPNGRYRVMYSSENVFPEWISQRGDFEEVDRLIKEQHLSQALQRPPHARKSHDLDLVTNFVSSSWAKAQELGTKRVHQLARCVTYHKVEPGDYILTEGENSRSFYIIVSGQVDIHKKAAPANGIVATLGPGMSFGEIALEQGATTASVIAKKSPASAFVELLVLYKSDYDQIMKDFKDCEQTEALKILKNVPMFKSWARSRLERVVQLLQRKRCKAGTIIIKQGDPPDNVYFIHEGLCDVTKDIVVQASNTWPTGMRSWKRVTRSKVKPFKVLTLYPGGFFGEKAIVEDTVRAATVVAATDVSLLMLDKVEFMALLNQGHKMNDAYAKTQGYPSDEDILSLFNTLNIAKPSTNSHKRVQKSLVSVERVGLKDAQEAKAMANKRAMKRAHHLHSQHRAHTQRASTAPAGPNHRGLNRHSNRSAHYGSGSHSQLPLRPHSTSRDCVCDTVSPPCTCCRWR